MAENLRVTRYNNEDDIPTDLSGDDWGANTEGACAIYPYDGGETEDEVEGINSDAEMVEAYGKLYNYYAVYDARGLCPEGWSVPNDDEWTQLVDYVVSQGYPNDDPDNLDGAGNVLKSCRQVNSPLEGCKTLEHPRWNADFTHHGFDEFGFLLCLVATAGRMDVLLLLGALETGGPPARNHLQMPGCNLLAETTHV